VTAEWANDDRPSWSAVLPYLDMERHCEMTMRAAITLRCSTEGNLCLALTASKQPFVQPTASAGELGAGAPSDGAC
jgi:hypothetical protein